MCVLHSSMGSRVGQEQTISRWNAVKNVYNVHNNIFLTLIDVSKHSLTTNIGQEFSNFEN